MAETVGIATRYFQNESTHAAIQLAESIGARGTPVSILARDVCRREVARLWDSRVIDERKKPFKQWCQPLNRVVWLDVPPREEVAHVKKYGIQACLLVNWERLVPDDFDTITAMDKILLPTRCATKALQTHMALRQSQAIQLPWSLPLPITTESTYVHEQRICVHFPLYDTQARRVDWAIFTVMRQLLEELDDVVVSVACGRRWAVSSQRAVKQLCKDFGDRARLSRRPNILQRAVLFANSDVTIWPPRFESFGLVGLTSLYMGTPVISWDIAPQNEYLQSWKNSVLIPCNIKENWLGVPEVTDDYAVLLDTAITTLRDKALLAKLRTSTNTGLLDRRKQFEAGLTKLLN